MEEGVHMELSQLTPLILPFSAGAAFSFFVVAIVGRTPRSLTQPLIRLVRMPFSLFARFFLLIRLIPKPKTARNAVIGITSALERKDSNLTEIEKSLRMNSGPDETALADYDFAEEERLLKRDGFFFRSIRVPDNGYIPGNLTNKLSEEVANEYLKGANAFFSRKVPIDCNNQALYEDAEGGVVISLFLDTDRRCYYALDQMRKIINDNARRLVFLFSLLLIISVGSLVAHFHYNRALPTLQLSLTGAIITLLTIVTMLLVHSGGYQKQQQHAVRELSLLLSRYLDRINDRFRDATTHAMGVTVGEEKNSKKMASDATRWHKLMMWMPFRAFFIESFVRNIKFQIERNCGYYLLFPPALIVSGSALIAFLYSSKTISLGDSFANNGSVLIILISALVFAYIKLIYKVVIANEFDQSNWLGFDNLSVGKALDDVVGKYAEEVGYWKNRLER